MVLYCYRSSLPPWYPLSNLKGITSLSPLKTFLKANSTETCMKVHRHVMQWMHVCDCTDYVLNNMAFTRRISSDTLMQIVARLLHFVAEISRFKFDDNCVIRTGTSDLKFLWAVYCWLHTYRILDDTVHIKTHTNIRDIPPNLWYKPHQFPKLQCFSFRLGVIFAQSIGARC